MFDNSPYFDKMHSSIVESVSDKINFSFKVSYDCMMSDLDKVHMRKPAQKTIDYVVNAVKEANDSTRSIIPASIGSAIINCGILYVTNKFYNGDVASMPSVLRDISVLSEAAVYTLIATPLFYKEKRKEGLSKLESMYELLRFGITGGTISATVYRYSKGEISQFLSNETSMTPVFTLPVTQLLLMYPFAFVMALLCKPAGYAIDKTKDYLVDKGTKTKDYFQSKGNKIINGIKNEK